MEQVLKITSEKSLSSRQIKLAKRTLHAVCVEDEFVEDDGEEWIPTAEELALIDRAKAQVRAGKIKFLSEENQREFLGL